MKRDARSGMGCQERVARSFETLACLERQLWAERGKPEARFGAKEHAARDDLMETSDPSPHMEHRGRAFKVNRDGRSGNEQQPPRIAVSDELFPYSGEGQARKYVAGILDTGSFVPTD